MPGLLDGITGAHEKLIRPSGGCHNCPRRRVDFVPATLPQARLICVGEAPGATEVQTQEGFTGRSGTLLRTVFAEYGITEFALTNTVHCRPPENTKPNKKTIDCCLSQFVLDEISDYKIVVLVGGVPLQALFPQAKAWHFRGNIAYHPDFPEQRFYAIYHPAYILRNPAAEPEFKQQIERLARIVRGEPAMDWRVLTKQEGMQALDAALQAPLISLDFETTKLESWEPTERIKSFSLTADGNTAIFVHEEESHWVPACEKLRAYLMNEDKSVVGANVGFDLEWFERELDFGVLCSGIHCVLVQYNQLRGYKEPSLKYLVPRELDGYRYLIHEPGRETDVKRLALYNGEDAIQTYRLFLKAMRELQPRTRDLCIRSLGPVCLPLRQMQATGIYLRLDYRDQKIEEYAERRKKEIEAWCAEDPAFIPTEYESGNGLLHYMYDIHKLPVLERTKTGAPSTDKRQLKQYVRDGHSFLQHLLNIREIDKIVSTYLTAYDKHVDSRGRIHSSFINTHTDSGRTSSRSPNLQNIPRKPEIRDLFGVPPGSMMMEADLSQIEFRIMVCLAQDETGIAAYQRGEDAHTATARTISGKDKPSKEERSLAKPVNFALLYGGSWEQVQRAARDDYDQDWDQIKCETFTSAFFNTYKRMAGLHAALKETLIMNRGWSETVLGHHFFYEDWNNQNTGKQDHAFRSHINRQAQGPAAQIDFAIMGYARRLLNKYNMRHVRFVNHVHDSTLIELPQPKEAPDVIEIFQSAVDVTYEWIKPWFHVPLIMDYATGLSDEGKAWGSLEEVKR